MNSELYVQANKIWSNLAYGKTPEALQPEIDAYRSLLGYFMSGDFYYYIFNVRKVEFELVSKEIFAVLGHTPDEMDVRTFIDLIHPDDQPYFLAYEAKATKFVKTLANAQVPNYKISYDYRMRKASGEYIRILHQTVAITHDENNAILRTFGVHTDISHFKKEGSPTLSFIGLNGQPSYFNIEIEEGVKSRSARLTDREFQILKHLVLGQSSDEIGKYLFYKQTDR